MTISRRGAILAGTIVGASMLTQPAQAQSSDTTQQAAATDDGTIIVTARKRSEALADVPAAVTAITADDRKGLVLDRMADYLRQVPGAALVSSGPEYLQDITLRGQGAGRLGFSETATGIFRNGLYNSGGGFGGRAFSRMDVFDAAQVEVMRGPQGALYGRNSVGGAIDIQTHEPEFVAGGSLRLRYGTPDRSVVEAVANVPIVTDRLAVRLGGMYDLQSGGFYRDSTGAVLDLARYAGLRGALKARVGDGGTFNLLYEYTNSRAPAYGAGAERSTRIDGTPLDPGPFVRNDMNRYGDSWIEDHLVTGSYVQDLGGATLNLRALYKTRSGGRAGEDNDHFAGLSSIDVMPGSVFMGPDFTVAQTEQHDHWMVQAYLASAGNTTGPTWLFGVEYLASNTSTLTAPDMCPSYTGAAIPVTPGCFVGGVGTLSSFGNSARNTGRLNLNNDSFRETLRSPSVFGSVEFPLGARTRLEVATRLQHDVKNYSFMRYSEDPLVYFGSGAIPPGMLAPISIDPDSTGPLPSSPVEFCPPTLPAAQCAAGRETLTANSRQSGTYFTPAVSLRHRFSPDLNAYLRFATGYRPGGFNTNLAPTTVPSQVADLLNYGPERAYSGEMGLKGRLLGINYSLAGYYVRTTGIQFVTAASAQSRGFILQNAGNAHVYGVELEMRRRWNLGSGAILQVSAAASSQGGEFESGASALIDQTGSGIPTAVSLEGLAVPRLRKLELSANSTLSIPIGDAARFIVNAGVQHAEGGIESPATSRPYAGYTLVDGQAGVQIGNLRLTAFVKNLTNDIYVLNVLSGNTFYSEPRTYGVELRATF